MSLDLNFIFVISKFIGFGVFNYYCTVVNILSEPSSQTFFLFKGIDMKVMQAIKSDIFRFTN